MLRYITQPYSRLSVRYLQPRLRSVTTTSLSTIPMRSHKCGHIGQSNIGERVTLVGWLQRVRTIGPDLSMSPLFDSAGMVQIAWKRNVQIEYENPLSKSTEVHLTPDSIVRVSGLVTPRPTNAVNKNVANGMVEVWVDHIEVLNVCGPLPFTPQYTDNDTVSELVRLQYRYLDLRRSSMQETLKVRHQMSRAARMVLESHGFIEVETPTLFRSTPEGSAEFIVPAQTPGMCYSLVQSPQQFKQMLMTGGVDRYYQFARCYRDENQRSDRQPEFTQIDMEFSFPTIPEIHRVCEHLIQQMWKAGANIDVPTPFPHMSYKQAIDEYGVDKPDIRFDMKIFTVDAGLPMFEKIHQDNKVVRAIHIPNGKVLTRSERASLELAVKQLNSNAHPVLITHDRIKTSLLSPTASPDQQQLLQSALRLPTENAHDINDLVYVSIDTYDKSSTALGRLRILAADILETNHGVTLRNRSEYRFLWVDDFPLFTPNEADPRQMESTHHPFTAPHPDDVSLLTTEPAKVRGLHYDLVCNGWEIGGGSVRVHNAELQRYIMERILKVDSAPFSHLLNALQHGTPPHAGIAFGFDRIVAILRHASTIREVMAFPKSSSGRDVMCGAPAPPTPENMERLNRALQPAQEIAAD